MRWLPVLVLLLGVGGNAASAWAEEVKFEELHIGGPPALGSIGVKAFEGLAAYLTRETGAAVHHDTHSSYADFTLSTARGDFDISVTPTHLGYVLMHDYGFQPLAGTKLTSRALVVALAKDDIRDLAGLRGHELATPGPLANPTAIIRAHLLIEGLSDIQLRNFSSHTEAILAVLDGRSKGAVVSSRIVGLLHNDLRSLLHTVWRGPEIMILAYLSPPHRSPEEVRRLRELLTAWAETDSGRDSRDRFMVGDFIPMEMDDLEMVEPYVGGVREFLRAAREADNDER